MSAARVGKRCSSCGYYLPVDLEQSRAVEAQLDHGNWSAKVFHEVCMVVRRALVRCGVCGWRCEIVAGSDRRGCELWWRDE